MKKYIKLSHWAKLNGYTYQGAFRLHQKGLIENTKVLPTGTILVQEEEDISIPSKNTTNEYIIYCRVSSSKQRDDLDRQVSRMTNFATNNGYTIKKVYKEVGSGMNDNRQELLRMIKSHDNCTILVEHKDRLTRFGFNYLKLLCEQKNIDIIVANEAVSEKDELMNDLISVVTSFCAKLYGSRKCKRKTETIVKELNNNND